MPRSHDSAGPDWPDSRIMEHARQWLNKQKIHT